MLFSELYVGQKDSLQKTFTDEDVRKFADITTDVNPIHLDEEYAKTSIFGRRIAHGILVSGLISAVIANVLPGPGSIYMGQELRFTGPVFLGDTITAEVEVAELREDKRIAKLITTCTKQDGTTVITGHATVKLAK